MFYDCKEKEFKKIPQKLYTFLGFCDMISFVDVQNRRRTMGGNGTICGIQNNRIGVIHFEKEWSGCKGAVNDYTNRYQHDCADFPRSLFGVLAGPMA